MRSTLKLQPTPEILSVLYALSPLDYIRSLGFPPYQWQADVLSSFHKRKLINGARQSGKSTIISALPCHHARFFPKSVSLVVAPTERQAVLNMERIKSFIAMDKYYVGIKRQSDEQIELSNGSMIYVVPATEKSARGYSSPDIIMLDEASRIDDITYRSGIMPMLTDNEKCELVMISTPNGRTGFYHTASNSARWERYEVRAPWDVIDLEFRLVEPAPEQAYRTERAKQGIAAYYSLRHRNHTEQQMNLEEMGPLMYRQEYCCEFVEPEDQVFAYEDIEAAFNAPAEALDLNVLAETDGLAGF
jgi:hypothetical protein